MVTAIRHRAGKPFARLWPDGTASDPWNATSGTDTALYELRDYWNLNMGGEDRTITHMLDGDCCSSKCLGKGRGTCR